MARPIWQGNISFGLINIPVTLYSAEKPTALKFHLVDSRNQGRVHYERINDLTGKVVPWDKISKVYEYKKGKYIPIEEQEFEKAAPEHSQTIELMHFVDHQAIDWIYFSKPYYLVPIKQGEKGYVLLRETLEKTGKIGIAKLVIKTRQYLAALFPYHNILILNLLRFPNELRNLEEYPAHTLSMKDYKISKPEIEMAVELVNSMSKKWDPHQYHDENKEILAKWIQQQIKRQQGGLEAPMSEKTRPKKAEVIDFMDLLKQSLKTKGERARSPGKRKRKASPSTGTRRRRPRSHPVSRTNIKNHLDKPNASG